MQEKIFKIPGDKIKQLITPIGSCIASDKITVDGLPIGYMYRETPTFDTDSGWRFFSGNEDDEYVNNPDNLMIYDVNTVVNYDFAIVPYLNLNVGVELERQTNDTFKEISNVSN